MSSIASGIGGFFGDVISARSGDIGAQVRLGNSAINAFDGAVSDFSSFGTNFSAGLYAQSGADISDYLAIPTGAGLAGFGVKNIFNSVDDFLGSRTFVGQEANSLFGQGGAVINGKYIRTVPADVSARFQGNGFLDPLTNTFKPAPLNQTLAVDHIFPVKEIQGLRGFNRLTTDQQIAIIHDTVDIGNFQPLPKSFNSSKGSKLV